MAHLLNAVRPDNSTMSNNKVLANLASKPMPTPMQFPAKPKPTPLPNDDVMTWATPMQFPAKPKPTPLSNDDVMTWLRLGVPITLLFDLITPPKSHDLYVLESVAA